MYARASAILVGVILSLVVSGAQACGESLFRVGKGVAFRQYTAPLPGSILAVASSEAELLMIERLVAAGHDVHVVADTSQIGAELATHDFDIVIAYYSQRNEVASQTAEAGIDYIPVAMSETAEEREAKRLFDRSLASDDSVKTFLKTIHRTLKSRG